METTYLNDSIILKTLKKNPNPIVRRLYTIKTELSNATLKRIKKKRKKKRGNRINILYMRKIHNNFIIFYNFIKKNNIFN